MAKLSADKAGNLFYLHQKTQLSRNVALCGPPFLLAAVAVVVAGDPLGIGGNATDDVSSPPSTPDVTVVRASATTAAQCQLINVAI